MLAPPPLLPNAHVAHDIVIGNTRFKEGGHVPGIGERMDGRWGWTPRYAEEVDLRLSNRSSVTFADDRLR